MSFLRLMCKASQIQKRKTILEAEKKYASSLSEDKEQSESFRLRYKHRLLDIRRKLRRKLKKCIMFPKKSRIHRFLYRLIHHGSCENFVLKSIAGFIGGFLITYIFFMFFVFQLNFKFSTATIMCSIFGSILTIGLAFSYKVRCIVFLTLPQLFSKRGRQALLAYAFILAITGPAKNTLNNMGILSESLACGQEQLKSAVKQIIDVIKKPFYAIRDAIKTVVKVVKAIVKKIKEVLLAIKRVIVSIIKVIKAVFQFLAKIINVCNKELGTPFQRCTRVFENAITDCRAKLGPTFSWLCSITYLAEAVCYTVKFFDFVCTIIDFISTNIVGVVVKKVKNFIRHVKTMFYVRIKFSHSFHFETNASKSLEDVATGIVTEIKERTAGLVKIFNFISCATSLFFMFIIVRVLYYRYKFLTDERFDNRFINKDFRAIDMRRAQLGKETVLPLNQRERNKYVQVSSLRLVKKEKLKLSQSAVALGMATLKLATHMMADYALFWVLMLIRKHASFQSTFEGSKIPTLHVKGEGFLADLLRSIVKAFQPVGIRLEIDTIPCLPDPIPPDYDRYVQIASLLVICWILTVFEPYGLRWRHSVMCYYHPLRAKERAIWLYNQIIRTRSSFLKFARRQLRRKFTKDTSITKITCKEYLAANLTARCKIFRLCIPPGKQTACLLCGEVFRDEDSVKPIKCQTPGCPGVYCEKCFEDLQNLCTICLDPIQYGDLSDISEEKDSSADEASQLSSAKKKKKKKCIWCKTCCGDKDDSDKEETDDDQDNKSQISEQIASSDTATKKETDSDYYSTENENDTFDYQYKKDVTQIAQEPPKRNFEDLEKQPVPDYESMESFRKEEPKVTDIEVKESHELKEESPKIEPEIEMPKEESKEVEKNEKRDKSLKKKQTCFKWGFKRKTKEKHTDEIPLLDLQLTTTAEDEDDDLKSLGSTTTTSYIETELSENEKRRAQRKRPQLKKRLSDTSTETSYIDSPLTKSTNYAFDFDLMSYDVIPKKKTRLSMNVPKDVPKLDLNFDVCDCDNPFCKHRSYVCKALDKRVRYHTEIETSSDNHSVRSITFSPTTTSEPLETSPSSETTTVSTSVRSPRPNKSSPHETINYLYDPESHSPDIDHNKPLSTVVSKPPTFKGKTSSSTTVSDVHVRKFKKKIHDYYKQTNYERTDNPKVKSRKHQSRFTKFLNRLLRKDIFDRTSTRPSLTKSFLSGSNETSSKIPKSDQEQRKILPTSNVQLHRSKHAKSQYRSHNVIGGLFTDLFCNIFMGGSSTKHSRKNEVSSSNKSKHCGSDESFDIIAEKFGYYDSTDSEISELQFPIRSRYSSKTNYNKSFGDDFEKIDGFEEIDREGLSGNDTETKDDFNFTTENPYDTAADTDTKRKSKLNISGLSDTENDKSSLPSSYISDNTKSQSDESKSSQMSKQSYLDRRPTRYSREPPERDQNYEDNLKSSSCQCRNPDCKRRQDYNSCCPCPHNKTVNFQSQYCPDPRPKTTYDLAKSAENIRQNDLKLNTYNTPKRATHSSPEVSKNRLPIKTNEMNSNDNGEYMYNDYMSSRSGPKNDCYSQNQDQLKNRYSSKYPYEEPLHDEEYQHESHGRNCSCDICCRRMPKRDHYRNCKCYECIRTKRHMDDQMSSYSEESQGLNLAYQKTEEYPVLVDEIENTISMRNKERVRKTMRQFELLSRQNKSLDKPIYDDDEDLGSSNRFSCNKRPPYNRSQNNGASSSYCYERPGNYQSRSECLSERPAFSATPFPRNRGYVEKVARFMDPSMTDNTQKYPKFQNEFSHNGGAKWQMDPRSGEWVKVYDGYDFENNYPPLPPTPSPMYRDYDNYPKNQSCHNYYNASSHRSASPPKHNANKPCGCRNCMGNQGHSRY